ncbi:hypothetical protein JYT85_01575 [Desulfocapsa sp. AH-315-G09]|nr:hypothetical protein [Desulfocapsa sp.]MBN4065317.1 hypothetical protein [Desulfocapsa sp. AH-315-G09]
MDFKMLEEETPYSVIRRRLQTTVSILILIPVSIVFLVTSYNFKKCALRKIEIIETGIATHRMDVISLFLQKQENLLTTLTGMYSLDYLGKQELLDKLFTVVNKTHEIVDLHVIDSAGKQVAYVGPYRSRIENKNYHGQSWFEDVLINGKHVSNVFTGYRGVPHFVVAVTDPLKTYVLRATVNSEIFNALLFSAKIGPDGDAFIVNRQGEFQTPSLQGVKTLTPEERDFLKSPEATTLTQIGPYLYATSWLKDDQWLLVIKSRVRDSLGLYYKNRDFNIAILIITSVVVLLLAAYIGYYMVRLLEKMAYKRQEVNQQMVQVEKMATVGRLAAGIAHEINNPLQMITNQAGWIDELLVEENPGQVKNLEEYKDSIDKIRYHVKRAGTITHRLLGFSRKMKAEKECVNVNDIIEETLSFVENDAKNNNIQIEKLFIENLPPTMSDAPQLQQVFLNLLNNSLDAIGTDGKIEIRTRADADTIYMEFADSGTGINPAILDKIFDPFFTTKDPGKGTGLGMSICYDIMRKLGGTIDVRNGAKKGAVFTLTLPIRKLGE